MFSVAAIEEIKSSFELLLFFAIASFHRFSLVFIIIIIIIILFCQREAQTTASNRCNNGRTTRQRAALTVALKPKL